MASVICREMPLAQPVIPAFVPGPVEICRGVRRDCAKCEVRDGIATTKGWGYYASRGGTRMLVIERRTDQRIRINESIEIVVLEADNDKVRLGIKGVPGVNGHGRD